MLTCAQLDHQQRRYTMMPPFETAHLRHMPVDLEAPTDAERQAHKILRIARPNLKEIAADLIAIVLRRHNTGHPFKASRPEA